MAARKNITVVRQETVKPRKLPKPHFERAGKSPVVIDPLPTRTPMNVAPKIIGTDPKWHSGGNFTTPFNLTPRVADEEDD